MSFLIAASYGEEIVPVSHRLNEYERAIKQQRNNPGEDKLCSIEIWTGRSCRKIGQDQRKNGERREHSQCGAGPMDLKALFVVAGTAPQQAQPYNPVAYDHDRGEHSVAGQG